MELIVPMLILLVLFYLILVLPVQLQNRRVKKMQASLGVGDEVITTGGLIGWVKAVAEAQVTLELSEGVRVQVVRSAIVQRRKEGLKSEKA